MPPIMLNGPYDWDAFEQTVFLRAAAEHVLHLVQLEDTDEFTTLRRRLPTMPEYSQYKAKVPTADQTSKMNFVRGEQPAKSYYDLVDEDKDALKIELTNYEILLGKFNREADGICHVFTWMIDHMSPSYIETCAPALVKPDEPDNLCLFVNNLREACCVTDAERRRRAQELYFEALKEAENSNKKTDWEKWITNWEQAIAIARLRKVDAACGPEWFKDLERHLDSRFEMLLRVEKSQNRSAIDEGTYKPAVFSTAFRGDILTRRSRSQRKRTRRKKTRLKRMNRASTN